MGFSIDFSFSNIGTAPIVVQAENTDRAGMTPAPVRGKQFFDNNEEEEKSRGTGDGNSGRKKPSLFGKPPDVVLPENTDRAGMTPAPTRGKKKFNFNEGEEKEKEEGKE